MPGRFAATTQPQVYLTVTGAEAAVAFYTAAFDGVETYRHMAPDGTRILHTTLALLGGHIMLSDELPVWALDTMAPASRGGASVTVHINLETPAMVDAVMSSASDHGATITMAAQSMEWGAYYGRLIDPFGLAWSFAAGHK